MALKTGNPRRSTVDPKLYSIYESPDKQGVDFFTEGQKLTQPLKDTEARFIKEKAEDQKAFDERNKSISEIDISQDQSFNALSLRYSQDMANNNMSDFDKVKRGEMSRTDFKIRQNNRSQSIATWGSTVKDYNTSFETAQKRMQDNKSGLQEQTNMRGMAGFGNMENVVLIDDPNSAFGLMIELTDEERATETYPSYKEDPSRYVSATQANARMNQKIDKVNVVEKSKQYSETLGTTIKAYMGEDSLRTKEDFLLREGGNKLISDYAKAVVGEGNETASILADNIGGYTFTTVESEAGGKVIYQEIQSNGNHLAKPTEEQIAAAQEYTEGVIKSQLDIKETVKEKQQKSATTVGKDKKDKETLGYVGNAVDLQTVKTDADFKLVAEDIKSDINKSTEDFGPKIDSIKRDSNSFTFIIKNADGSEETKKVPRKNKDNKSLSVEDVAKGILKIIAPIEGSTDNAIDLYRKNKGDDAFTGDISDVSGESITTTKKIKPIGYTAVETQVFTDLGDTENIDAVSIAAGDLLNSKLRKLNMQGSITIEQGNFFTDGEITIKIDGVGEETIEYDGDNANVLQLVKTYVENARKISNAKGEIKGGDTDSNSGGNIR